jgi:Bax protein
MGNKTRPLGPKPASRRRFEGAALALLALGVAGLYAFSLGSPLAQRMDIPREVLIARGLLPPAHGDEDERPRAAQLYETFVGMGYDLNAVANGEREVPRLYLASLPADMDDVSEPALRKNLFLRTLLPLVLKANEAILADRRRLFNFFERVKMGQRPGPAERDWFQDLARRYEVEDQDLFTLFQRVDVIPPSLALAQAAEESGWGTSRFAQKGNALFGQWTTEESQGLVPAERRNAGFAIRSFSSLGEAVRGYALNLNTHPAYRDLRQARWQMRELGQPLDGFALAGSLSGYSERGSDYVATIRTIIRTNGLATLDDARLAQGRYR